MKKSFFMNVIALFIIASSCIMHAEEMTSDVLPVTLVTPVTRDNLTEFWNARTTAHCTKACQDVPVLINEKNQLLSEVTKKVDKLDAVYVQNSLTQINQNTLGSSLLLNQIEQDVLTVNQNVLANNALLQVLVADAGCTNVIDNANVNPNGFMITESGTYCLSEDISFAPTTDGLSAIVVNAPNVVIQMNNNYLDNYGPASNISGILVNQPGCAILNGSIGNFDNYGIRFNSGANTIQISNVQVQNCGNPNDAFAGISINQCNDIVIDNIVCQANYCSGLELLGVQRANITNSFFVDNVGGMNNVPPFGLIAQASGAYVSLGMPSSNPSSDIQFNNCNASNNSSVYDGVGILVIGTIGDVHNSNARVLDCDTNGNSGGGELEFQIGSGVAIVATDQFVIRACTAQDNVGANSNAYLMLDSSNGFVQQCVAERQTSFLVGGFSFGFSLLSGTQINLEDCVASNIISVGGNAFGFFTDLWSGAIYDVSNNIFAGCTAQNVSGPVSAGFGLRSAIRSIVTGCTSLANGIGILMADPAMPQTSTSNIINNNIINGNSVGSIVDQTPNANNAYFANIARNITAGTNYIGVPAGTPIRTWPLPAFPSATDNNGVLDTLDNIDITP